MSENKTKTWNKNSKVCDSCRIELSKMGIMTPRCEHCSNAIPKEKIEVCENCGSKWPAWKFFTPTGRIAILCERCLSTEAPIRYPNSREEAGYILI